MTELSEWAMSQLKVVVFLLLALACLLVGTVVSAFLFVMWVSIVMVLL